MGVETIRTHVVLPKTLVDEMDRVVGPRKRSHLIAELLEEELRRRRRLDAFDRAVASLNRTGIPEEWSSPESTERWLSEMRRDRNDADGNRVDTEQS